MRLLMLADSQELEKPLLWAGSAWRLGRLQIAG